MSTNCPTCAGRGKIENAEFENRDRFLRHRFEDELMRYIRSNPNFRRESCFMCVEKHVSSAMQYHAELRKAQNSGTADGQAQINIYQNYLSICGELNLAAEEAEQWEDLHTMLQACERSLRYDHILPNWNVLMTEMLKVKTETQKRGLEFKENK
jgi:hypothetical protein